MGAFLKMISPDCILVDPPVEDKISLLRQMIAVLKGSGKVDDAEKLLQDILSREDIAPTGIGSGCAIPHAHSEAVAATWVAAARLDSPMDFGAPDGSPARLVFLLAGPPSHTGLHLKVLSKLARLLNNPELREKLLHADDAQQFYQLLCDWG